jgi:hypothetical protein
MPQFQIRDVFTNEVLVDKLSREEVIKQFKVYEEFFGKDTVYIARYEEKRCRKVTSWETEYKDAFIEYFAELQVMGNLL